MWVTHGKSARTMIVSRNSESQIDPSCHCRLRHRLALLKAQEVVGMDYTERLRRLAINDLRLAEDCLRGPEVESSDLCPKSLALVRLAALIAVDGAVPSYLAQAESAMSVGATCAEIVDVLLAVVPIVGFPRVVAAAPKLALALGYDIDAAFEAFDW